MAIQESIIESLAVKHINNVGFTTIGKDFTQENRLSPNPHLILSKYIPAEEWQSLVPSEAISLGRVKKHVVKMTPDSTTGTSGNEKSFYCDKANDIQNLGENGFLYGLLTVPGSLNWAITLYEDNGSGTAPDYTKEIILGRGNSWAIDASTGILWLESGTTLNVFKKPFWLVGYTYVGKTLDIYEYQEQSFNNLLINSSFEHWFKSPSCPDGWEKGNGNFSIDSIESIFGGSCLKIEQSPGQQYWIRQYPSGFEASPPAASYQKLGKKWEGRDLCFSVYAKANSSLKTLKLRIEDGVGTTEKSFIITGEWVRYKIIHRVNTGADRLRVYIAPEIIGTNATTNVTLFVDGVMLTAGAALVPWRPKTIDDTYNNRLFGNLDISSNLVVDGKVGIGTNALTNLDVSGRARFQKSGVIPNNGYGLELYYDELNSSGRILAYDRTSNQYKKIIIGDEQNNQLVISDSGNKIGINEAIPTEALHINGNILIQKDNSSFVMRASNGLGRAQIFPYGTADGLVINHSGTGRLMHLRLNDASKVIVENDGKTKIYAPIISYATGDGVESCGLTVNATQNNTSAIVLGQNNIINWRIKNAATSGDLVFSDGSTDYLTLTKSGSLGVGSSPSAKLHIANGTAALDTVLVQANANGTGKGLVINTNTRTAIDASVLALQVIDRLNTSALAVTVGGSVAIGNSAPAYPLDVAGNTQLRNDLRIGGKVVGYSANGLTIQNDTTDGADTKYIGIQAGGDYAGGTARGGYIDMFGNEHATYPGMVRVVASSAVYVHPKLYMGTRPSNDNSWNIALGKVFTFQESGVDESYIMHNCYWSSLPTPGWKYRETDAIGSTVVSLANGLAVAVAPSGTKDANTPLLEALRIPTDGTIIMSGGTVTLSNALNNLLIFRNVGQAAPTFTNRSVGTKIVLYPAVSAAATDIAMGVQSNAFWFSTAYNIPGTGFKWYGGTTELMDLRGDGKLGIGCTAAYTLDVNGTARVKGDFLVGSDTDTVNRALTVKSGDGYNAIIQAYGSSQGTGVMYVGQSGSYGGGMFYNGDGTPAYAIGEAADKVSFFRREGNVDTVVFDYGYGSDHVCFRGNIGIGASADTRVRLKLYADAGDDTMVMQNSNAENLLIEGHIGGNGTVARIQTTGNAITRALQIGRDDKVMPVIITGETTFFKQISLKKNGTTTVFSVTEDTGSLQVSGSISGASLNVGNGVVSGGAITGSSLTVNGVIYGQATALSGDVLKIGNESMIFDCGIADTIGIKGVQNPLNGSIVFGSSADTNLFRNAANQLRTNDSLMVDGNFSFDSGALVNEILISIRAAGAATDDKIVTEKAIRTLSDSHTNRIDNPHNVTSTQVGLGNVPNWSSTDFDNRYLNQSSNLSDLTNTDSAITNLGLTTLLKRFNSSGNYGSISINGSLNGWAGIYFNDYGRYLMVNAEYQGFYTGTGWQWSWNNGVLENGQVPIQRVSGKGVLSVGSGLSGSNFTLDNNTTIGVNFGGTGSQNTVSRSDHNHDAQYAKLNIGTLGSIEQNRDVNGNGIYSYNITNSTLNRPSGIDFGSSLTWGLGSGGSAQLLVGWIENDQNWIGFRSLRDVTNNWWEWKRLYHTGFKPTASEIGALPLSGGNLSGPLSVAVINNTHTINMIKNGAWSTINMGAQNNDPGFIAHYEDNNFSIMRFSASDDRDTTDRFEFGSTPGGNYSVGATLYTNGLFHFNGGVCNGDFVAVFGTVKSTGNEDKYVSLLTTGLPNDISKPVVATRYGWYDQFWDTGAYRSASTPIGDFVIRLNDSQNLLTVQTSGGVHIANTLFIGADTNLFRHSANVLRTNDGLIVDGGMNIHGGVVALLNETANRIDFLSVGVAPPKFTDPSAGTKIRLYPSVNWQSVDYAIGIDGGTLWNSVPDATNAHMFKWYGGTTQLMTLSGDGELSIEGGINASSISVNTLDVFFNGNIYGNLSVSGRVEASEYYLGDYNTFSVTSLTNNMLKIIGSQASIRLWNSDYGTPDSTWGGSGGQYGHGATIYFGDGNNAYIQEYEDDVLKISSNSILLDGSVQMNGQSLDDRYYLKSETIQYASYAGSAGSAESATHALSASSVNNSFGCTIGKWYNISSNVSLNTSNGLKLTFNGGTNPVVTDISVRWAYLGEKTIVLQGSFYVAFSSNTTAHGVYITPMGNFSWAGPTNSNSDQDQKINGSAMAGTSLGTTPLIATGMSYGVNPGFGIYGMRVGIGYNDLKGRFSFNFIYEVVGTPAPSI